MGRAVVFVCAHGAARSGIAAAWFNINPPAGWQATTAAGEEPAPALNQRAEQLLAGLSAHGHLDHSPTPPAHRSRRRGPHHRDRLRRTRRPPLDADRDRRR